MPLAWPPGLPRRHALVCVAFCCPHRCVCSPVTQHIKELLDRNSKKKSKLRKKPKPYIEEHDGRVPLAFLLPLSPPATCFSPAFHHSPPTPPPPPSRLFVPLTSRWVCVCVCTRDETERARPTLGCSMHWVRPNGGRSGLIPMQTGPVLGAAALTAGGGEWKGGEQQQQGPRGVRPSAESHRDYEVGMVLAAQLGQRSQPRTCCNEEDWVHGLVSRRGSEGGGGKVISQSQVKEGVCLLFAGWWLALRGGPEWQGKGELGLAASSLALGPTPLQGKRENRGWSFGKMQRGP